MRKQQIKSRKGFTLIELLIAASLTTIILGAISMVFISTMRTSAVGRVRLQMQQNIRDTLGYMSRMIRFAGIRPVDEGIEEIGTHHIIFQCDRDGDGITNRYMFEYIDYQNKITLTEWVKSGANYNIVRGPETVMPNVSDLVFAYYTKDNVETTNPAEVTAVRISITMIPPPNEHETTREFVGELKQSTLVYCPNLAWRLPP